MKKRTGILTGFSTAAALGLGVATGFIHEEKPKTPEQCLHDLRTATKGASLKAAAAKTSLLEFSQNPEIKQETAYYIDCIDRYAAAQKSIINIGFGWK